MVLGKLEYQIVKYTALNSKIYGLGKIYGPGGNIRSWAENIRSRRNIYGLELKIYGQPRKIYGSELKL